jgi:hypothetical protein
MSAIEDPEYPERPFIRMFLSGFDNGSWKDASLNWIEETQENGIELIAPGSTGKCGKAAIRQDIHTKESKSGPPEDPLGESAAIRKLEAGRHPSEEGSSAPPIHFVSKRAHLD